MKRIYDMLLLHRGPIHEFDFSIFGLKSSPEIDQMILFLSKKDVQVLKLHISCILWHKLDYPKMPSCLISFLQLRRLKLFSFIFQPPPSFKGFSKLTTPYFRKVQFDADLFKNFISSCPLLERLTLSQCTEISSLRFNAPNLKYLSYYGDYKSICFKTTPLLAAVSISNSYGAVLEYGRGKISNLSEVFNCLPVLEVLSVDTCFLKIFAVPDASMRLRATWNHLKALFIYMFIDVCFAEQFLCALSLLRNSPNLRELMIELACDDDDSNASTNFSFQLSESDAYIDFSLNQLHRVSLEMFNGDRLQVELVELLFVKSSALKVMHIMFSPTVDADEELKILEDLLRAKRASVEAEIKIVCNHLFYEWQTFRTYLVETSACTSNSLKCFGNDTCFNLVLSYFLLVNSCTNRVFLFNLDIIILVFSCVIFELEVEVQ